MEDKYRYFLFFLIGIFPFLINGYLNPKLANIGYLYWTFEFVIWIFLPLIIFYLLVSKHGLVFSDIGIRNPLKGITGSLKFVGICILVIFIDMFFYRESIYFFYNVAPNEPIFSYKEIIPDSGTKRLITIWYLAITAGVVEELYFRGLLHKISGMFGSPMFLYLLVSPIAFALIHWEGNLYKMGATYIMGVIGCVLYLWLRNIWPLIVGHIYTDVMWFQ